MSLWSKVAKNINTMAADMWSFAVLLWELTSGEIPFSDLSPMEAGMKISTEGLRIDISGISSSMSKTKQNMAKLIKICMHEDPAKRPTFEQVITILDKMKKNSRY